MFKALIVALGFAVSSQAVAAPTITDIVVQQTQQAIMAEAHVQGLDWKVGDTNNYNIDMGFIKGTMDMTVRSIGAEGIWMDQNMDLGFAGKQKVETLLDPNTGEVKKMIVNGKEQAPPKNNIEVIDMKEDKITVPAGSFDCIHVRIKDKDNNNEINVWINPSAVPLSGMLKTIQPSQFGNVTVLLKSFKKN